MEDELESITDNLKEEVLSSYASIYKEILEDWESHEKKAQVILSVSGIFLAAIFAFIRNLDSGAANLEKGGLVLIIVFFGFTVMNCLSVLRTIKVPASPHYATNEFANDLLALTEDEILERKEFFRNDKIDLWKETTDEILLRVEEKADSVQTAQILLVISIILSGIFIILKLLLF